MLVLPCVDRVLYRFGEERYASDAETQASG